LLPADTVTWMRRIRGALLRLALSRPAAVTVGLALALPAAVVAVRDYPWESWVTDGLGLILGATGVALVFTGFAGRRPDWVDPDEPVDR
jgi:hypothetical protein